MRERILDAAAGLILKHGLRKFTLDEIAAELHISKKTIYQHFGGKDEIIAAYFDAVITSDKASVEAALGAGGGLREEVKAIAHSSHRYRLPASLVEEAKLFYPAEWAKVGELKAFKLGALRGLLAEASASGELRPGVNFPVLERMLDEISDLFVDYGFLVEARLRASEAIDEAVGIILEGILADRA